MAKNKENNKMKTVTSLKRKPKTHLKDVNGVFRITDPENKSDFKNNEETCISRSFYTLQSHRQNALTELFDKTESNCSALELNVCTEKNKNMSSSTINCVNRNDQTCNLHDKQKEQPEGKEFRQMSGRQKDSGKELVPDDCNISVTTDCDNTNADILISNFSNLSLSKGTKDLHSMPSPPVTDSDLVIQRVDGNGGIDSWYLGNVNHNTEGSVKRKIPNEIDKMGKNLKKKKGGTKLLRRTECIESYLCIVKRKSGDNHEIYNNKKKSKCEVDVERNIVAEHTESNVEARDTEIGKTGHADIQPSKKNVICSADLITVINKIMYSNHDKPNLKFYPDMFLKCTCQPSACTSIHLNDGSSGMEEYKAFTLKSLMKAKLWASAFNNFYTFLTSEYYLTTSLLRLLFHFIMTTSDTLLMNKAVEIITCHWDMHPPCRENMRKHYLSLLTESETADKDLPIEVSNDGLLYCILNMLESAVESPDQNRIKLVRAVDFQDLSIQPVKHNVKAVSYQEMLNRWQSFDSFENNGVNKEDYEKKVDHESQKEDEQYLTNSEQIERLLLALELITELMERDMAVWLVKYSVTPFKYVRQNSCCPLIGKVGRTTTKQVLKLYHSCRQHKHSRILARFIGLLAEVARVSEIQDIEGKGLIQYPYFSTECCLFVEDVYISFINSNRTTDEKLELLELLQPAWVRMFVASHWLSDNLGHDYGHDLECTIKILQSKVVESELFRSLSVENSLEACAHEEGMCKANTVTENAASEETHENKKSVPSRKRKKKASTSDLSEETIHVLIIMTASYIKTYCLQEIYDTLKYKDLFENVIHNYSGQDRKGRVKLRFNYVQIVNDIQNYRELRKVLKSLCENTQVSVFHSWLSVFYTNS